MPVPLSRGSSAPRGGTGPHQRPKVLYSISSRQDFSLSLTLKLPCGHARCNSVIVVLFPLRLEAPDHDQARLRHDLIHVHGSAANKLPSTPDLLARDRLVDGEDGGANKPLTVS